MTKWLLNTTCTIFYRYIEIICKEKSQVLRTYTVNRSLDKGNVYLVKY